MCFHLDMCVVPVRSLALLQEVDLTPSKARVNLAITFKLNECYIVSIIKYRMLSKFGRACHRLHC